MEVFRELVLHGEEAQLVAFVERVTARAEGDWTRNVEVERRSGAMGVFGKPMYCFVYSPANKESTAALWLAHRGDRELYVTNIVPWVKTELTRKEYNQIVEIFHKDLAADAAAEAGVRVEMTTGVANLEEWLSVNTARLLKAFSALANKATGIGHPLDHKRWMEFVIQAHIEDSELDATTLARWLQEEEDWSEETAFDLSAKYEDARELLRAYDSVVRNA
jgi:hypothetical protein